MNTLLAALRDENDLLKERIRQLEEALAPSSIHIPAEFGLSRTEETLFRHMASRDFVSRASIMTVLYGASPDDEPPATIVSVWIGKLRRKVRAHGVSIVVVWARGYRLENRQAFLRESAR